MNLFKQRVAEYFSYVAPYWGAIYSDPTEENHCFPAYAKSLRKRIVLECLDTYAAGRRLRVLDTGCGPGVFLSEIARRGHTIIGIDISQDMVRAANVRLAEFPADRYACMLGDVEALPFGDGTIDVVLCSGVLPYLVSDTTAVEEITRVLKSGGLAIVVLPNLVKLGSLFDPFYYLVRAWQYVWFRLLGPKLPAVGRQDCDPLGDNTAFAIRRYGRKSAIRMLNRAKLSEICVVCGDFGPLTFWRRPLLPVRLSIMLSNKLRRLARLTPNWMGSLCNEWVICLKKKTRVDSTR